jgi:hypothetical protein
MCCEVSYVCVCCIVLCCAVLCCMCCMCCMLCCVLCCMLCCVLCCMLCCVVLCCIVLYCAVLSRLTPPRPPHRTSPSHRLTPPHYTHSRIPAPTFPQPSSHCTEAPPLHPPSKKTSTSIQSPLSASRSRTFRVARKSVFTCTQIIIQSLSSIHKIFIPAPTLPQLPSHCTEAPPLHPPLKSALRFRAL